MKELDARDLGFRAMKGRDRSSTFNPFAIVHRLAYVEEDVQLGNGTKVWQFASVIRGAVVGSNCNIGSTAIVDGCRVGNRCLIGHGAFLDPGMVIGDDVFLGPHAVLCNDFWPRVSKSGWYDINDLIEGRKIVTRIENGASVGANATILPGLTIGANAMIAAGAVVDCNVPEWHLFRREGVLEPIDPKRYVQRMREAV